MGVHTILTILNLKIPDVDNLVETVDNKGPDFSAKAKKEGRHDECLCNISIW